MTIRNLGNYLSQQWDWACLKGCFGNTKIEPTDIDGIVERFGHFLLLETKGVGVPLNTGQRIFLESWMGCPHHSAIIIWGPSGAPVAMQVFPGPINDGDMDMLRGLVSEWFAKANQR